ncbi:MAG TPA: Crp/Fnr family transcriptional regulator [bacterium]
MEHLLDSVPLFQALPSPVCRQLASECQRLRFGKGAMIFEEHQPAEAVWVLKRGVVFLVKRTPQGSLATIFTMTPDEALCGISAFERGTYSAGALAATDAQVVRIPSATCGELISQYPQFAEAVITSCIHRMRHMAETIRLGQAPVEQRLASVLLRLRTTFGVTIPLTHHELARMAGTRWETSIRTLSTMKRKGWITSSRGKITVLAPEQLRHLVDGNGRTASRDGTVRAGG